MSDPVIEVAVQELAVEVAVDEIMVEVAGSGPAGPQGAAGAAGAAGPANLFIQNAAPSIPPATYLWIQTGLGAGTDMTFWVQDAL